MRRGGDTRPLSSKCCLHRSVISAVKGCILLQTCSDGASVQRKTGFKPSGGSRSHYVLGLEHWCHRPSLCHPRTKLHEFQLQERVWLESQPPRPSVIDWRELSSQRQGQASLFFWRLSEWSASHTPIAASLPPLLITAWSRWIDFTAVLVLLGHWWRKNKTVLGGLWCGN